MKDFSPFHRELQVQVTPQLLQVMPQLIHVIAQIVQTTNQLIQGIAQIVQTTNQLVQVMPQIVQNTPQIVQTTPQIVQATPQLVQATPQTVQATPHIVQNTPHIVQNTAHIVQNTPHIVQVMPQVVQVTILKVLRFIPLQVLLPSDPARPKITKLLWRLPVAGEQVLKAGARRAARTRKVPEKTGRAEERVVKQAGSRQMKLMNRIAEKIQVGFSISVVC